MTDSLVTIVIPVYNEEETLPALLLRVREVVGQIGRPVEVILVDDGSTDRSFALMSAWVACQVRATIVRLNRNYGQHAAVAAGFEQAEGEIIVTLDADLQNPPEEIPRLLETIDEGFDVVGTVRRNRHDPLFRRLASRVVNWVTCRATGVALSDYGCMLRAYRRRVVRMLLEAREISTFIPVLADMFAREVTEIEVGHEPRRRGRSKYSVLKLLRLQFDLLTSFTLWPLRAAMLAGIVTAALSFLAALALLSGRVYFGSDWAEGGIFTVVAGLFFLLGVLLFAIGLLGEYVGRIYVEVRRRPRYVLRSVRRSAAGDRISRLAK